MWQVTKGSPLPSCFPPTQIRVPPSSGSFHLLMSLAIRKCPHRAPCLSSHTYLQPLCLEPVPSGPSQLGCSIFTYNWEPGYLTPSPLASVYHWLLREGPPTIARGVVLVELHEVGAGTGDGPVVVDETQVGAGASAPISLTRIRS